MPATPGETGCLRTVSRGQIDAVIELVADIERRHGVRPHRVLGHSYIQPQTKSDPGPQSPMHRSRARGAHTLA